MQLSIVISLENKLFDLLLPKKKQLDFELLFFTITQRDISTATWQCYILLEEFKS
jgi:hypothetical protein